MFKSCVNLSYDGRGLFSFFGYRFCFGFCLDLAVFFSDVLALPVSEPAGEEFVEPAREVLVPLFGVVILP